MTPRQIAGELETLAASITEAIEHGDAHRLDCIADDLAGLAHRLRDADQGQRWPLASRNWPTPGELADRLTAGLDGPHADENTADAARLAAEAVRFVNYATGPHASLGVTYPATVYTVTASLSLAASRLPQACGQMAGWLHTEATAGHLGDDHGGPVSVLTDRARFHLDQAARHADALARALADAQAAIATVHGTSGSTS
jgi:hypothetical protein